MAAFALQLALPIVGWTLLALAWLAVVREERAARKARLDAMRDPFRLAHIRNGWPLFTRLDDNDGWPWANDDPALLTYEGDDKCSPAS